MSADADEFSEEETARRMERVTRRFLDMPPQPHGKNPKSPPIHKPKERQPNNRKAKVRS